MRTWWKTRFWWPKARQIVAQRINAKELNCQVWTLDLPRLLPCRIMRVAPWYYIIVRHKPEVARHFDIVGERHATLSHALQAAEQMAKQRKGGAK